MKPAPVAAGEVTVNVVLTLAPGATGAPDAAGARLAPEARAVHLSGRERLNRTPATGDPVVFVNVAVTSCFDSA